MGLQTKFAALALAFANAAMAIDIVLTDLVELEDDTTTTCLAQEEGPATWLAQAEGSKKSSKQKKDKKEKKAKNQNTKTSKNDNNSNAKTEDGPTQLRYFKSDNYQKQTRTDKMDDLWSIITSDTSVQPLYWKEYVDTFTGLSKLSFWPNSDEMKSGRLKTSHTEGVVAKIKWIPDGVNSRQFSGIYQEETDNVILRLSETANLHDQSTGLMPALALKFLIDGEMSANLFGMPAFTGSESWDFFKHDFGSRVDPFTDDMPIEKATILKKLIEGSEHPYATGVSVIAKQYSNGTKLAENDISAPYALRWTSTFAKEAGYKREKDADTGLYMNWYDIVMRDVRNGDIIFQVEGQLGPKESWVKVAEVEMKTDFTTSKFADERLYFEHTRLKADKKYWPQEWKRANDYEEFDQDENDMWGFGLDVPKERWPSTDADAKEFYIRNVTDDAIKCPFGWLLDNIWSEHLQ